MLYRSAYAERTKFWCLQNNHQIVSSVSGESWPLEPPEVRDQYNEYAKIERENHQKAHPDYKFSPSKTGTANRKRKGFTSDDEEEPSDLDDPDMDWAPPGSRKTKSKSKRVDKEGSNARGAKHRYAPVESQSTMHRSRYEGSNPGKPLPHAMGFESNAGYYYQTQTSMQPNKYGAHIEDVLMRRTETPGSQYGSSNAMIGMPGGGQLNHLQQTSHHSTPAAFDEQQVDPMLLAMNGTNIDPNLGHMMQSGPRGFEGSHPLDNMPVFEHPDGHYYPVNGFLNGSEGQLDFQAQQQFHPGMQTLTADPEPWGSEGDFGRLENGNEFEHWTNEPTFH